MRLHREGTKIILFTFMLMVVLWLLITRYVDVPLIRYVFLTGMIIILLWVTFFFRIPKRKINYGNHILSSADGKVVAIEEVKEEEYFNEPRLMISVFMSPWNVHVNWYPFEGEIKYSKYHPGRYFIAHHPKSSELNECTSVVLEKKPGQDVLIRQVAGIMARRIICYAKPGDKVKQGEEMGMIRFGSRVDFFLPVGAKVHVKIGQTVKALTSVIAAFE
ncbi:MAG: phosphatidylserine decarboxylase family protein [Chlorobi bacterium]|nr:phosphatidylserine decarboxylase family protein [Chlorobiota bacterium]